MRHAIRVALSFTLFATNAAASFQLAPSTKGPFYIQGKVIGFGLAARSGFGSVGTFGTYHMDVEFGWHFPEQKHQAFAIGVRQAFYLNDQVVFGATMARFGYDLPFDINDERFELTLAPYGVAGALYPFSGGEAAFIFGVGIEGRFFFWQGLYAMARPVEIGALVNGNGGAFQYNGGLGIGYAF
jgi:hypothetical protein